jgi:hypothetical protein
MSSGGKINHQDTKSSKNHQEMIFAQALWRQSKILFGASLCLGG